MYICDSKRMCFCVVFFSYSFYYYVSLLPYVASDFSYMCVDSREYFSCITLQCTRIALSLLVAAVRETYREPQWNNVFSLKSATAPFSQQNTFCNETCVFLKFEISVLERVFLLLLLFRSVHLRVFFFSFRSFVHSSCWTLSLYSFLGCIVYHFWIKCGCVCVFAWPMVQRIQWYWFLCSFSPIFLNLLIKNGNLSGLDPNC